MTPTGAPPAGADPGGGAAGNAAFLRPLVEQLRALAEELRTLEREQHEELVVRALKKLVVRAFLRNMSVGVKTGGSRVGGPELCV